MSANHWPLYNVEANKAAAEKLREQLGRGGELHHGGSAYIPVDAAAFRADEAATTKKAYADALARVEELNTSLKTVQARLVALESREATSLEDLLAERNDNRRLRKLSADLTSAREQLPALERMARAAAKAVVMPRVELPSSVPEDRGEPTQALVSTPAWSVKR